MELVILTSSILLNLILTLALWSHRSDAIHEAEMEQWECKILQREVARLERELDKCDALQKQLYKPVNRISRMYP